MRRAILNRCSTFSAALAALTVVGCSSDSVTGLGEAFDARATASIVEAAASSEWVNLSTGHASMIVLAVKNAPVASIVPGLDDGRLGALELRGESPIANRIRGSAGPRLSMTGRNGILPDEVLGKTFTLAGQTAGGYGILEGSEGPSDGARFHMYELDPVTGRPRLVPPSRAGQLDLLEPVPNAGLQVFATDKGGDVLSDLTLARTVIDDGVDYSSTFTSSGMLVRGSRFDYSMIDHVAFSQGFTRVDFQFDRDVESEERDIHVTYETDGYITSNESDPGQVHLVMTVRGGGHHVVLDAVDTGVAVAGSVSYDGQPVVLISGDPFEPTFTNPDGSFLAEAELNKMWELWYSFDLMLYFGDALLIPLTTLIN